MKIAEVRKLLEAYDAARLRFLIGEMYKAIPKRVKEDQQIDALLKNPQARKGKPRKKALPDIFELEQEALELIENAYAQNYLCPNRIVPKRERPKWRFIAKRLYKQLIAAAENPEDLELASQLLENLYQMLCYSCTYTLFTAYDTFESVGIGQDEFFRGVLELKSQREPMPEFVGKALDLTLDTTLNRYTLHQWLIEILMEFLPIPDLKLRLVAECEKRLTASPPPAKKRKSTWAYDDGDYEARQRIRKLAEAGFRAYAALGEYGKGIAFFKKYYKNDSREVDLFVLLQILEEKKQFGEWIAEYESALKNGVSPRQGLREQYGKLVTGKAERARNPLGRIAANLGVSAS